MLGYSDHIREEAYMKRLLLLLSSLLLMIVGCQSNEKKEEPLQPADELKKQKEHLDQIEPLITSKQSFHFIVDWLSEEEVVFVELRDNIYYVMVYHLYRKELRTLYEESSIIADVYIHPTKEYLLLHTSESDHSATVKMIDREGEQIYELNIESNELEIQWNDLEPRYLMVTAFYEDWSYSPYFYNAYEHKLVSLDLPDPFPKWLGEEEIVIFSEEKMGSLGGNSMKVLNIMTQEERLEKTDILYYDTFASSLLTMKKLDATTAQFDMMNEQLGFHQSWQSPLISNYSEWVIPEVAWLDTTALLTYIPVEAGLLDELSNGFTLNKIDANQQVVADHQMNNTLRCAPNKTACLMGPTYTDIYFLSDGESQEWLRFEDDEF